MTATTQAFTFQTEVQKVLDILIYSLYTHKEIFLRELISNASDALDKVNYLVLTQDKDNIADPELPLGIRIRFNEKDQILTIADSGIGMSYDELKNNLGTIAHSGSAEFISKLNENKGSNLDLIGQFGVGFYSVFMIGKEVRVHSRSFQKEQPAHVWISDGKGGFRIEESTLQSTRGTTIEILVKDEEKEFLDKFRLEGIINKYSNFVNFPILVNDEQVNKISALWTKNKSEITPEQYSEFYKFISKYGDDFLTHLHLKFDSPFQFSSILFFPGSNLEKMGFWKYEQGIHLYCKRILIQTDNKDLLPPYLRFIFGVVDSEDLNLNVSRETIQNDPVFSKIKSNLTKKILDHLHDLASKEPELYTKIWVEFSRFIKEGVHQDFTHRERIVSLLRFHSSKADSIEAWISLEDYLKRMQIEQKEIYYLTGPDLRSIQNSSYLEIFKKEDIEVLYLDDPMDEFVLSSLTEFKEKKFISVEQANIDYLNKSSRKSKADEPEKDKALEQQLNDLMGFMKLTLKDEVVDVIDSIRLVDSPACLVNAENAPSSHVQKLLKMMNKETLNTKKILEINLHNPIIMNLAKLYQRDPVSDTLKEMIRQLYENSLVAADGLIERPETMIKRIEKIMQTTSELLIKE